MARYLLLAEHVSSDGRVLPAGTEVGDGTSEPWPMEPSGQMDPLDADALEKAKQWHIDRYGEEGWKDFEKAMEARRVPRDEPEEVKGPPVSKLQAEERGEDWKEDEPPKNELTNKPATMAPASGQIRPKVEVTRPTNPNKDQYPKDG